MPKRGIQLILYWSQEQGVAGGIFQMDELELNGGCACGSIRYECKSTPILTYKCHCRDCQRGSGCGYLAFLWVHSDKLHLTSNQPRYYAVHGESGRELKRGFCPECGSNVLVQPSVPFLTFIVASSLDDPSIFEPQLELWTSSAQPWDMLDTSLRHFDQQFTDEELGQLAHF